MTVCTVNHLPAATHGETARCLFAIELSKQSWVIGFITPLSAKMNRRILSGGDWRGLLEVIEEMRARVSRETGRAVEATRATRPVMMVSGYTGSSKRTAYAITLLIRRACKWTGGCDE